MSRYRASLIHLLVSAFVVGNVVAVVFWVWYPSPAFEIVGAFPIIRLLVGVDLVLGPLLTLVVYKHGKPGLKFDLAFIALVQIVALVYGSYVLFAEKPRYIVFAVDRVEFIAANQIDEAEILFDELRTKEFATLIRVFASAPEDPEEFQKYFDSIMFEGLPDLERRPEFWEPWSAGVETIRQKIISLDDMNPLSEDEQVKLQQATDQYAGMNVGALPVGGTKDDISVVVDIDSLEILSVLRVNPWPPESFAEPDGSVSK